MPKKTILFAPCAFNLAESSRMVEIAKAIQRHPAANLASDIHFISDGDDFVNLFAACNPCSDLHFFIPLVPHAFPRSLCISRRHGRLHNLGGHGSRYPFGGPSHLSSEVSESMLAAST
jgi:hypothetical protein